MTFEIIREPRGVIKRLTGFVSVAEYQRSIELVLDSAFFDELRYVIVDASKIDDYDFTEESLGEIALVRHIVFRSNPRCVIAFVVTSTHLARLIVHAVFPVKDSITVGIVTNLDDARLWIERQRQ